MTAWWRRLLLLTALGCWAASAVGAEPRRGMFLLASTQLQHPMWRETVILLLEHDRQGSLGVILNRPLTGPLPEWFPDRLPGLRERELRLYRGGPVGRDSVLLLLRNSVPPPGGTEVVDGVFHGPPRALLKGRILDPTPVSELRVFSGHAGWAPGQLMHELERGDWRLLPADAASVFELDSEQQYRVLLHRSLQQWVRYDADPGAISRR